MIHYFAKNFFNPILVSPHVHSNGELRVSLISDLLENQTVSLTIEVYRWDSFTPVNTTTLENNMVGKNANIFNNYFLLLNNMWFFFRENQVSLIDKILLLSFSHNNVLTLTAGWT